MKTAKIFKNGNSQAIRLPKELQIKGKEVCIQRVRDMLIITPKNDPMQSVLLSLELVTDDFMEERVKPRQASRKKSA